MPNIKKIESEMKRLVASILQHKVKDKTITMVSVTDIEVTKDLSVAKIYYSVMGKDTKKVAVEKALQRSKGFVKSIIAKEMKLRKVPDLEFIYDDSLAYGNRIDEILQQLKEGKK